MRLAGRVRQSLYILAAFFATFTLVFTDILGHAAANQITARSITISRSSNTATNVEYKVGFTVAQTGNIGGVAIDFCSNDPIIGDSCTAPGGFNTNKGTTTVTAQSGTGLAALTVDTTNSTANTFILTAASPTSVNSGTAVTISLGNDSTQGITNPTGAVGSFYARIYTYATAAAAQGHSTNTPSGYVDYGGIALSTVAIINITAKVQETLSFCVYPHAGSCGTDPSFTIGHPVGTAVVIDANNIDVAQDDFSLSTNANGGVVVRLHGDTLKSGPNSIHPAGAAAITFATGTENFGLRISTSGTNITAQPPYDGGTGTQYAFDVTTAAGTTTPNVTSTFGGEIASLSGATNNSVSTVEFAAAASNVTPAGTYTAAEQMIATGTF